jgi:hypothetical protein
VRAEQFFSRTGSGLVIPGSVSVDSAAQKAGATVKASVEEKGGQRY